MQTMDSRIGLDFIVENPEYIRKLAAALDTSSITVKKQVFELLSALCVYNEEGHARALDTLEHYKKLKGERYRLSLIVKELDHATVVDYQTALVAFINCLIISTPRLTDRTRLRNEFIGCHLLPVLNNLRKCAEAEPELAVQLDVFDEQRESDDAQSMQGPHGVDLNSPLDVFYAILKQVAETPQEIPFLSILQHLLRIDPKEAISDIIWDTAERLVHRATLVENREDASRLLRTPSIQSKLFCHCQHQSSQSRRQSLNSSLSIPLSPQANIPPPPIFSNAISSSSTQPTNSSTQPSNSTTQPPPPPPPPSIPSPPTAPPSAPVPPPPMHRSIRTSTQADVEPLIEKLPQQEIPQPKIKMKTINWNKIPENKVIGKNNIWTQVACSHQDSPMADMDWSEMEGLFCQQVPPSSAQSSPKLGNRDSTGSDTLERRMRKENTEVTLLDGKRSLNVNIFLKQFRSSNEDIIQLIRDGEHDDIGAEKIKGLLKILPEVDELDMLKSYNGDFSKLGNAEKFLLQLTNLPNYKLRIESMLIKEEFASNMGYLEPSINSMINAAEDLMTNKPLKEVLYMVLVAGNFLNSGGYAGNAAGVKLSSLQKITDIRANKPNMNLIHFVALQAEKRNKWLLSFTDNTSVLEDAAKTTVEQLQNEINALESRIKKNKKQIEMPSTEHDIKLQMTEFLLMAEREVAKLQRNMRQLENVRKQLADFFCEDANQFKLEECFRIFHGFYCKFKQAVAENERRRIQEEQANARRRQREELLATKRKQMGLVGAPDSDCAFVDTQIYDSRTGFPMKKGRKAGNGSNVTSEEEVSIPGSPSFNRTRLGSFNGNDSFTNASKDERSPDITPNGSLRRRRSRVLSEEDEGTLMDFLRTSGHDVNRERKSWGSLDRSWARRARGSGPRKRPALLGADFSSDRERPSSPSPLGETKPILPASEEESKPKEWRQKIESWLQANESDQVTDEARKQARRITNRRSFELDSESDRSNTLDPLPEGKQVYSGGQSSYRKVYPDWRPSKTIESTDVVGAMEAVEEAQQPPVKDKSAWRKSTLNVANSCEETKQDSLRYRHTIPRMRVSVTPEEDSRKNLIASLGEKPASDKLTLYIRRPSDTPSSDTPSHSEISERHTSYTEKERPEKTSQKDRFVKDRYVKEHHEPDSPKDQTIISNKVEIDQDNIETPPATRRIFTPSPVDKREPVQPSPCKRLLARSAGSPDDPDPNNLGDGQFDRFSAARRTRRYKKATDHAELRPAEHADVRPTDHGEVRPADHVELRTNELIAEKEVVKMAPLHIESSTAVITEPLMDSEARLKAWQQRLKMNESETKTDTKVHRRNRNQTGINQDEVKMALKISSPIDIDSEKQISKTYITPDEGKEAPRRSREDDEGFEENLSLMSESPSQGASSGGNFEPDTVSDDYKPKSEETTEKSLPKRQSITKSNISLKSTRTVDRSTRTLDRSTKPLNAPSKALDRTTKPLDRSTKPLDRSNALRHSTQEPKKSVIPRRSNSLRKTASQSSVTSQTNITKRNLTGNNVTLNNVQRSSSRNSIGSSRTSINSVTSTNTVKRGPPLKPSNGNTQSSNRTVNRSPSIRSLNAKPAAVKTGTGSHIQRPPRPQGSTSFMKPTTASTTKASMVPTRVSSFRSKN